jgi:hypothetical protein
MKTTKGGRRWGRVRNNLILALRMQEHVVKLERLRV